MELIKHHMHLVHRLAKVKKKSLPSNIHLEELVSAGYLGLVKAAKKYDPSKGPFESFAKNKIFGEMSDYLRELVHWGQWTKGMQVLSLDEYMEDNNHDLSLMYHDEVGDSFDEVTKTLPRLGQQMLRWRYVDELTCKQIGERLGVGESWAWQMLSKYEKLLKTAYSAEAAT